MLEEEAFIGWRHPYPDAVMMRQGGLYFNTLISPGENDHSIPHAAGKTQGRETRLTHADGTAKPRRLNAPHLV